ncbi:endonuclease/exonuclease/phosphatase family protein [Sphingobacterium sp. SGG-5]|uniref:endonuclease/exonuclease/phosphatase family protein n=1 Tax=Sphingobacterium sp. SGG-5 TaxID=2710881 RepID=UPI0013EBD559|nr:endonuclease/exonuclease/phosphatase family protein [Sphingobacterium sp. SGG-5]NGM61389.1 endonuclease/exonuclease/phosphatase family protein [Sphingobacterium sp. SGG-5]
MKKIFFAIIGIFTLTFFMHSCRESFDAGDWDVTPTEFLDPNEYTGPTKTLKVMSVNFAIRQNGHLLEPTIDVIKAYDPDLLFLRQADSKTTRAGGVDRPQEVADALGMNLFFKGRDYGGGQFGNAVLSKFPITEELGVDLTYVAGQGEQRMLAMIKVEVEEDLYLYFAGTELETNADDRRSQAIDILRVTEELTDPVIFVGNFNEQWTAPQAALTYIEGSFKYACASTGCAFNSPKANPTGTYDYITYQDPNDLLIVSKTLEAFKDPETPLGMFPTTAEIKIKLEE